MKLIIDADPIVYRAGFAGEENHWEVIAEDKDGEPHVGYFRPSPQVEDRERKTAWANAQEWLAENELTMVEKHAQVLPHPQEHVLHICKTQLQGIIHAVLTEYRLKESQLDIRLLLSGPGNFRETLATLKPYKGNRDTAHKPYHYQAIRDYLTGHWGARVIHGREADDEVSIIGWKEYVDNPYKYVIATIDKDLEQVPGMHYDYLKHVHYEVDAHDAMICLWTQIISGDPTDNIGGVPGYSAVKALRVVEDLLERNIPEERWWGHVVALYDAARSKAKCYYKDSPLTSEEVALENARLVYMQRAVGELWMPPGTPHGQLVGEWDE